MRPARPSPQGSDWIAGVIQICRGAAADRTAIFNRGVPFLLGLVGPDHLRFERNGQQLEVYVYQPRLMPKSPTWVRRP